MTTTIDNTFVFTDIYDAPYSSVVWDAYYNKHNNALVVGIMGDDGVTFYLYSGVPVDAWEDFVRAESAGRAFQTIKRQYGPGTMLAADTDFVRDTEQRTAVGDPQAWVDKTKAENVTNNYFSLNDGSATSGGMTNTYGDTARLYDLKAPAETTAAPVKDTTQLRHEVNFSILGSYYAEGSYHATPISRTYSTLASSVDEAVGNLTTAVEALDLEAYVESVTVYFE